MARPTGIRTRHARSCPAHDGASPCACKPSYEASVWSNRDGRKVRKTFPRLAAAKGWPADAQVGLRKRTFRAPTSTTLPEAADAWLAGARDGSIRPRSGDIYKPSAIRGYETSLKVRRTVGDVRQPSLLDLLGAVKLSEVSRLDLQDIADRMLADGLDPSTIRNTLMPVRAIFRRAVARGDITVNPTTAIELPAVRGRRDRIAAPAEARSLIDALAPEDRAVWATAAYAGLRRGELLALRWEDVDLDKRRLRVARSWDVEEGVIAPKSTAGMRSLPMLAVLRTHLLEQRLRSGRADGLVFGADGERPFNYWTLVSRAKRAWKAAELAPIGLHECRHTFAALMIAAGVNPKALSTFMGHASISITLDRYGHLFPGSEDEAAELAHAYLQRVDPEPAAALSS